MKQKSVWDSHLTVHITLREDMNYTLLEMAKDKMIYKSRVVKELIMSHPEFQKKLKELKKEGFFE